MNKSKQFLLLVLILFTTWFAYRGHFNNSFHSDDYHTIVENQYIRNLKNVPLFFKDPQTTSTLPANQAYRPGLTTLNAIDFHFSGETTPKPFMFHVSIFISFLICGILFYLILVALNKTAANNEAVYWVSLFATAAFLLHTANAETINYIIARSDSFSTLTVLLSFTLYLYFPAWRKWHFYFIPALLGFFVKEQTLMFIPMLMVYKLLFEEKADLRIWKHKAALLRIMRFVAVPLIAAVAIFMFSRAMTPKNWTSGGTDPIRYLLTQPSVMFHYVYNFIIPANLVIETDWTMVTSYFDDRVFAGLIFIGLVIYSTVKASRNEKYKLYAFGIVWFLVTLLPTSSIFPFAEVLNDHRPFLPYLGLFIAVGALITQLLSATGYQSRPMLKYALPLVAVVFLSLHVYGTSQRCETWKTEESLWKDATIKSPQSARAWMDYGLTQMAIGNNVVAENCFNKTAQIWPYYSYAYINLGVVKSITGRPVEAEQDFKKALALNANVPETYYQYARFLSNLGRNSEASTIINKGLAISPAHAMLTELKAKINNTTPSPAAITKPVTAEDYVNQSLAFYQQGKYESCIMAAQNALKLKPDFDIAYNNICASYNEMKLWDKAIAAAKTGLKFNPNNALLKANLDVAYQGKSAQQK